MTRQQFIKQVEGTQRAFRSYLTALCCGDADTADDIAQEAYLKAYISCDTLENPAKFKSWIFRIAYTTFIDSKRSAKQFVAFDDVKEVYDDAPSSKEKEDQYNALYRALDQLSAHERSSLLLFYMQEYSIKEIAGIEGVTESAVKQHLSRGRQHLRGLLKTEFFSL